LVHPDYYLAVGASAYAELESLVRIPLKGGPHADVYAELADGFAAFAAVLGQISEEAVTPQDLGQLLERWLRTRSEHLLRKLALRGMLIAPGGGDAQ
jgi:hypothetical protein